MLHGDSDSDDDVILAQDDWVAMVFDSERKKRFVK